MAYVCSNPESYDGKKVGNGHCVLFIQECTGAPQTTLWKKGKQASGNITLQKDTAIATFDKNGKWDCSEENWGNSAKGIRQFLWITYTEYKYLFVNGK